MGGWRRGGRAADLWEGFDEVVGEDEGLDQLACSKGRDGGTDELVVGRVKVSERQDTADGGEIGDALIADI